MLIEDPQKTNRALRSEKLVRETKLLNIARLAKMLVDLFGLDDQFKKVGKREGQEVEMYIPALKGYITFVLTADRQKFDCYAEAAKNPITRVEIRVKEKDILRVLSKIIRSKDNLFGILKVAKLYLLRKVKITGSFRAALTLTKCLMIGKNRIYKEKF